MKRGQRLGWALLIAGCVLGLAGGFAESKPLLTAGVLVAFFGLVAQGVRFKCPNCGKRLGTDRYGNGQKCPYCGGELEQP